MKTSELTGAALDWAVAKSAKLTIIQIKGGFPYVPKYPTIGGQRFSPSTDWAQGGPIIERELIDLHSSSGGCWTAEKWEYEVTSGGGTNTHIAFGPTPLIAAMRCYVASKLGDEVEIPEELT